MWAPWYVCVSQSRRGYHHRNFFYLPKCDPILWWQIGPQDLDRNIRNRNKYRFCGEGHHLFQRTRSAMTWVQYWVFVQLRHRQSREPRSMFRWTRQGIHDADSAGMSKQMVPFPLGAFLPCFGNSEIAVSMDWAKTAALHRLVKQDLLSWVRKKGCLLIYLTCVHSAFRRYQWFSFFIQRGRRCRWWFF